MAALRMNQSAARSVKGAKRQFNGDVRMPCPLHGGSEALVVGNGRKNAVWHCFAGCDSTEVRDALIEMGVLEMVSGEPRKPWPEDADAKRRWCLKIWREGVALIDCTPALRYFRDARGLPKEIMLRAADGQRALKWHAGRQSILASVTNGDWKLRGLHMTKIGEKKPVRRAHGEIKGHAIRLGGAPRDGRLAIAEGIETAAAWSFLHAGVPCWSVISASGVQNFQVPENVRHLTVAADFDGAGLTAYERLRKRLREEAPSVEIALSLPTTHGTDWNDHVREMA